MAAAKRILLESLAFDTRFLSQQSIMDYSLLLGLDTEKPEMVVGLVDAVGSYGLFKNIESRGKMAFSRGREGEVTVVSCIPTDPPSKRVEDEKLMG
jgi:1-phosphatidylinositol-3-phosphate 5-kinase